MCKAINTTISEPYSAREPQQDSPTSRGKCVWWREEDSRYSGGVPQAPGSVIQCQPLAYPVLHCDMAELFSQGSAFWRCLVVLFITEKHRWHWRSWWRVPGVVWATHRKGGDGRRGVLWGPRLPRPVAVHVVHQMLGGSRQAGACITGAHSLLFRHTVTPYTLEFTNVHTPRTWLRKYNTL